MNKFTFSYPTKVYFGEGSAAQAFGAEMSKVGDTVMLAYGGGSIKKNGIYQDMKARLEQIGKKVVDLSGIMPNPTYAKVQEGAALAREHHEDFMEKQEAATFCTEMIEKYEEQGLPSEEELHAIQRKLGISNMGVEESCTISMTPKMDETKSSIDIYRDAIFEMDEEPQVRASLSLIFMAKIFGLFFSTQFTIYLF